MACVCVWGVGESHRGGTQSGYPRARHLAIDVVHRLGVRKRDDKAAERGADRLDERDEVLVARNDGRTVVRGRDAVDDWPAAVLGEGAGIQEEGWGLAREEKARERPAPARALPRPATRSRSSRRRQPRTPA